MKDSNVTYLCKPFAKLSITEWHDIVKLRVDVFVVEQACPYPELDGRDPDDKTLHAMAMVEGVLVGYARALAPEPSQDAWRIGRVVVDQAYRRTGVARTLMQLLITEGQEQWPYRAIELSAQTTVVAFYQSLGFLETSDEYLEDGIPHIDMRRRGAEKQA